MKMGRNLIDQDKFTENALFFTNYNSFKKSVLLVFIPRYLNALTLQEYSFTIGLFL